jgi:hypothetical protein
LATAQHHIVQAAKIERAKCRTDLLYLCNEILGYKDINRRIHGESSGRAPEVPGWTRPVDIDRLEVHARLRDVQSDGQPEDADTGQSRLHEDVGSVGRALYPVDSVRSEYPHTHVDGHGEARTTILQQVKEQFISNVYLRELFPEYCPAIKKNGKVDEFGNAEQFTDPAAPT